MPTVLLIAQAIVLLLLAAGYIVVHYGPVSIRHAVAHYYYTRIHPGV